MQDQSAFWLKERSLFLAPMEGVTDGPMRTLLTEICPFTNAVTEFLRVSQLVPPEKMFHRHMSEIKNNCLTPSGTPVALQLLGGHAGRLAETAALAVRCGVKSIDINFGCPAPTVNSHDGGATLLRYPKRIFEIIFEIRSAVPKSIPVSVKMRLGWDNVEDIFENALQAERAGASWLTVHARTKFDGYKPPAHWSVLGRLIKNMSIPLIANGEIWTLEDFLRCQEQTNCSHYMLGRGVLANPFLVSQIAHQMGISKKPELTYPNPELWLNFMDKKISYCEKYSNNIHYSLKRLKQWMRYIHFKNPQPHFSEIVKSETTGEFLKKFKSSYEAKTH